MTEKKSSIDYIFWIAIFFYADPGGYILEYLDKRSFTNFLLVVSFLALFAVTNNGISVSFRDRYFAKIAKYTFAWFFFYYIVVFLLINSSYSDLSFISELIKTRIVISTIFIIIPIYYFTLYRNNKVFLQVFSFFSILIVFLLLIKFISGLDVIPTNVIGRGFVFIDRYILKGFGILEFGLYLLVALAILPKKYLKHNRNKYFLASFSVYLIYIFSLTRRYFFFVIIAAVIGYFISNYIFHGKAVTKYKSKLVFALFSILTAIVFISADYLEGVIAGFQTFTIFEDQSYGTTAARLGIFSHLPTFNLFLDNPFFGTGYINEWYSSAEDANLGFNLEGSDYVFQSSLAMFGIIGLLTFLPFYFLLYKKIFSSFKLIKINILTIISNKSLETTILIFLTISIFLIRHLFTYPDWFSFIGPQGSYQKYFIAIGLVLGSIRKIELFLYSDNNSNPERNI